MPTGEPTGNKSREELEDICRGVKFDPDLIRGIFAHWIPFPDKAYCEKVGWVVNPDGTVDTPGGFRIPTRELCEEKELEELYKLE